VIASAAYSAGQVFGILVVVAIAASAIRDQMKKRRNSH
jgi:hypothetical protein